MRSLWSCARRAPGLMSTTWMPKGCSSRRSASDSRLTAALLALYAPYDAHQVRLCHCNIMRGVCDVCLHALTGQAAQLCLARGPQKRWGESDIANRMITGTVDAQELNINGPLVRC